MADIQEIVQDLQSLSPAQLETAADFIKGLKRSDYDRRQAVLARTFGSLSQETADEMEKAIEEGCEKIDEHGW